MSDGTATGATSPATTFKAEIPADVLKEYVGIARCLVPELKITFGKAGFSSKAVDPSHVAMLTQELDARAFEDYAFPNFTGSYEGAFGVDLEKLKECGQVVKKGDVVTLGLQSGGAKLRFGIGHFERLMSVVDANGISQPKVPSVNPSARVRILTEELRSMLKGAGAISDHVRISVSQDGIRFQAEGESDTFDQTIPRDSLAILETKPYGPYTSMYPLDFLGSFVKALKSPEEVTLEMGTQYPLKITFETVRTVGKGRSAARVRTGGGTFLLAPRVEEKEVSRAPEPVPAPAPVAPAPEPEPEIPSEPVPVAPEPALGEGSAVVQEDTTPEPVTVVADASAPEGSPAWLAAKEAWEHGVSPDAPRYDGGFSPGATRAPQPEVSAPEPVAVAPAPTPEPESVDAPNVARWMEAYGANLTRAALEEPEVYGWATTPEKVEAFVRQMRPAFLRGNFLLSDSSVKRTCQGFGIRHTKKAIAAFLAGSEPVPSVAELPPAPPESCVTVFTPSDVPGGPVVVQDAPPAPVEPAPVLAEPAPMPPPVQGCVTEETQAKIEAINRLPPPEIHYDPPTEPAPVAPAPPEAPATPLAAPQEAQPAPVVAPQIAPAPTEAGPLTLRIPVGTREVRLVFEGSDSPARVGFSETYDHVHRHIDYHHHVGGRGCSSRCREGGEAHTHRTPEAILAELQHPGNDGPLCSVRRCEYHAAPGTDQCWRHLLPKNGGTMEEMNRALART